MFGSGFGHDLFKTLTQLFPWQFCYNQGRMRFFGKGGVKG